MFRKYISWRWCILIGIFVVGLGCSSGPTQRAIVNVETQPNAQIQPVPSPLRLRGVMEDIEIPVGQPAILDICLENWDVQSWSPLIHDPKFDFIIHMRDDNGILVPWTRFGEIWQARKMSRIWLHHPSISIAAKEAASFRIRLDELFDLTCAGRYSATVEFEFRDFDSEFHDLFIDSGLTPNRPIRPIVTIVSDPFSFQVVAPPPIVPSYAPISSESNKPATQPG